MSYKARAIRFKLILAGAILAGLAVFTAITAQAATNLRSARQLTSNTGWILAGDRLLWTSTAGSEWTDITPAPADHTIYGGFFLDTSNGWIVRSAANTGALELARTADGGANWSVDAFPLNAEETANFGGKASLDFADSAHGWIMLRRLSGSNFSFGMLFTTSDGGVTWEKLPTPPLGDVVHFTSATDGQLSGGPAGGKLYQTRDGGRTWSPVLSQVRELNRSAAVSEFDSHVIQVSSSAGTLTTSLDGKTVVAASNSIATDAAAVETNFINTTQGWVLVARGSCTGEKTGCSQEQQLLSTSNTGASFTDITPAQAQTVVPNSTQKGSGGGFDQCAAGSVSSMQTWFKSRPYRYANIYIGGANRGCSQANLNSSWIKSAIAQGWHLIPTWVGPQAPGSSCSGCSTISTNTSTAASQGTAEAKSASAAATALGLTSTVIYYDMEQYAYPSAAVKAFVNAWVSELHALGNKGAIYGNPGPAQDDFAAVSTPADDVWIADWNGSTSVWNLTPLSNNLWTNHQRIHQYEGGHNETYGGITFSIDTDSVDADVTPGSAGPVSNGEAVNCYVYNDGYSNMAGPDNAVYINSSNQACIPNGTAAGACRKWFGKCIVASTGKAVAFNVFNDGYTNLAGSADSVYINASNQACIPNGTAAGTCRKWFGKGVSSDGLNVACSVFGDGYSNQSSFSDAIFINTSHQGCVPSGSNGYCEKWWGYCGAK